MPHIYLISNGILAFQNTPEKLLNQTKETILITALEKIHIIGENNKRIFWQANDRFCIFGKIFQTGYQKVKGLQLDFSHSVGTLCPTF